MATNTPTVLDLCIYAGNAQDFSFIYNDSAGNPIPTIIKATMTLKSYYGAAIKLQKVAILDAPNALMTFTFTKADTDSLVPSGGAAIPESTYVYDIELDISVGLSPITITRGTITATGDIT